MRYGPFRASVSPLFYVGQWPIYVGGALVLIQLMGMVLGAFTGGASHQALTLSMSDLFHGQVWRSLTHWIPVPLSLWFFVSLIFFWFTSYLLENQIGRRRFVALCLYLMVLPVFYGMFLFLSGWESMISFAGLTSHLLIMGVVIGCARLLPSLRLLFGIPFKYFALVFVLIDVLQFVAARSWPALGLYLAAIGGVCFLLSRWTWLPPLGFLKDLTGRDDWRPIRMKSTRVAPMKKWKDEVLKVPQYSEKESMASLEIQRVKTLEAPTEIIEETYEVDEILDKISQHGIQSLTAKERKFLEQASQQLRRKS